ncbi:MAG TPA: hypothetical protein VE133_04845, partial [Candidatus Sulfotelmatobacter sp.]|nr:hypothetical protein [Candidatus Sulfotelmatobacter sp.]
VLLRLGEGMEEQARTRTDAQGAFAFQVTPDARHIVRVLHQGVNYDQSVNGAAVLEIAVFDAVAKVPDMSGSLGIARVEAAGQILTITEMYAITNASRPPVAQAGPRNFVFSMPPKATLDSFMVKKSGAVWVNVAPSRIPGQKDHYAVDFPLRPGETLFKFAYHLPYDGRATVHLKPAYPIMSFAVGYPPSMSFKAANPRAYSNVGLAQGLQLEQAVSKPVVREAPAFEISGMGAAPPVATEAQSVPSPSRAPAPPVANPRPAPAASSPASLNESQNARWIILTGIVVLLAAVIFGIWQRRKIARTTTPASAGQGASLVDALKEELFELETEKLRGAISAEQYDSAKQALNVSIPRAVARSKN